MLVKHEEKIIDLIKKKESIAQLAAEIPEDCLQLIVDILDPPFPIETQEDKELMIFMYITSLIRYIYIDNEGRDETGRFIYFPELFWMLESVYDAMPQYRTHRFYELDDAYYKSIKNDSFIF